MVQFTSNVGGSIRASLVAVCSGGYRGSSYPHKASSEPTVARLEAYGNGR